MQVQVKSPAEYYWGDFVARLKDPERDQFFVSMAGWCRYHGFSRKTVWALVNGSYVGGAGPKIAAIIRQALAEGLIDEARRAA